ncbi:ABC transporter permease [Brenneria tiliae]|uniref:ABC transporter permease n=1 Tax=Brenneria tiliae TaxID=2914984 RepID=UPI002014EFB2|nr:ABC transporter permease [Brenneria tiliae]MCL2898409.1 ABC transporter permease [Brenneria tiliae]MCL2903049.1 ABC transporter permease [Brenneria tiliae]
MFSFADKSGYGWFFTSVKRLGGFVSTIALTLMGLLTVTFIIGRLLPGDPVISVIGDRAPEALYQRVYHEMNLDRPLYEQFFLFCEKMLAGDFGNSLVTGNAIIDDMKRFFPATFELATLAIVIGIISGIFLGVICVRYPGRWQDHVGRFIAIFGHSVPVFWLGLIGLLVFYAKLGWVSGPGRIDIAYEYSVEDITGMVLVDAIITGEYAAFFNAVSHCILPASLLGIVATSYIARMTRGFLLHQMREHYVKVLRLKGLSLGRIIILHALPNSAGAILSVIAMTYAYLLEGAVLTETVFAWPGIGTYITNSLFAADINAVLTATLLVGIIYLALNLFVEWLQTSIDPRTRSRKI